MDGNVSEPAAAFAMVLGPEAKTALAEIGDLFTRKSLQAKWAVDFFRLSGDFFHLQGLTGLTAPHCTHHRGYGTRTRIEYLYQYW